jgi:hypothetical protein
MSGRMASEGRAANHCKHSRSVSLNLFGIGSTEWASGFDTVEVSSSSLLVPTIPFSLAIPSLDMPKAFRADRLYMTDCSASLQAALRVKFQQRALR